MRWVRTGPGPPNAPECLKRVCLTTTSRDSGLRVGWVNMQEPTLQREKRIMPTNVWQTLDACLSNTHCKFLSARQDPFQQTFFIDIDASKKFRHYMHDKCMCMTKSRPYGHWISSRGRRMSLNEMLAFQGMDASRIRQAAWHVRQSLFKRLGPPF